MTRRASWRGHLKFGDLVCDVGLYSALTSTEKISFNIVNRRTGNRVERQYVDSDTGDAVDRDDQVKGYELENGEHLIIEGDELSQLMPDNDKVIRITGFLDCDEIDKLYFDRPYYLSPSSPADDEGLAVFARAMKKEGVAALGEAVLFRRNRILLIRPQADALVATTLNYDYEVRAKATVFKGIPDVSFDDEMLELAGHIIAKRSGTFDPSAYTDRYNDALGELVKAKIEGRPIEKRAPEKRDNVIDLRQALRESAGAVAPKTSKPSAKKASAPRNSKSKKVG
ncbi:Ku protein [Rhizobium sp. SGZ-381]|uniref:non-homologous end joining protein Ku n=1 Tax=Rhizobium sp. SGZ-381 TaxID=3342800 RepID=UPI00366CCD62